MMTLFAPKNSPATNLRGVPLPASDLTVVPHVRVLTVGHSTLSLEALANLLRVYGVEYLVDVRTVPHSRHNPQFNGETLPEALAAYGIGYTVRGVAVEDMRMTRVFRSVQGRAQHGERGRLVAAAADERLKGVVYVALGRQDALLPMAVADLVPVKRSPPIRQPLSPCPSEDLDTLATRGEQLVRLLRPRLPYSSPAR